MSLEKFQDFKGAFYSETQACLNPGPEDLSNMRAEFWLETLHQDLEDLEPTLPSRALTNQRCKSNFDYKNTSKSTIAHCCSWLLLHGTATYIV